MKIFERMGIPGPKPSLFFGNLKEINRKVRHKITMYKYTQYMEGLINWDLKKTLMYFKCVMAYY